MPSYNRVDRGNSGFFRIICTRYSSTVLVIMKSLSALFSMCLILSHFPGSLSFQYRATSALTRCCLLENGKSTLPMTHSRRLFSSSSDDSKLTSTVVDRCTQKITSALSSIKYIKVLASNDDPNGSHVRYSPSFNKSQMM